uniref:Uncharacterized protein n=1 Tax=Solanum lycopersicum TaxID=4081 RepID=A0A3Q7F8M6_SOLLC
MKMYRVKAEEDYEGERSRLNIDFISANNSKSSALSVDKIYSDSDMHNRLVIMVAWIPNNRPQFWQRICRNSTDDYKPTPKESLWIVELLAEMLTC